MAVTVAEGVVRITADGSSIAPGLTDAIESAGGAGESSGRGFGSKVLGGVGKVFATGALAVGAVAATGIGIALTKGFTRLNAIDQAKAKLEGLGNSAQDIGSIMDNALASVKGTAFGLDEASTTAAAAVAAGIKPGAELEGVLKTVADTATIAGASMADMGSIFSGVAANGKASGDDIAQLQDAGVPALQFLAKHYGITAEAASDMVSDGKVDFQNFAAAMQENIGGAALSSGKTFQGAIANFGASLGRIGAGLLGGVFPHIAPALTQITQAFAPLEAGAASVGDKIGSFLNPAISSFAAGVGNLPSTIGPTFSSIVSVISGVGAQVQEAWGYIWSGLGPAIQPLFQIIGMVGPQIAGLAGSFSPLGLILKAILPLLPTIGTMVGSLATTLGSALASALVYLNPLITSLTETLSGVLAAALPLVAGLLSTLVSAFASLLPVATQIISALMPIATTLISALMPVFTQLAQAVLPEVAAAIQLLVTAIGPLVTTILSVLIPVINALLPVVMTVFNAIVPIIQGALQIVTGIIQVVTGIITGNWSQVWTGIQNIVGGVWNTITSLISGAIGIVGAVIGAGLAIISSIWSGIWNGIKSVAQAVWAGIVAIVTTQINMVRSVVSAVINAVRGVFTAGWNAMRSGVSSAVSGIVSAVSGMASGISGGVSRAVSFFTSMPGRITGALAGLAGSLASVGRNLMEGFISGVSGFAGRMVSAVTGPIKDAINGAKSLLGIHSPSRVFREIGDFVGQGLVIGLDGKSGAVSRAAGAMASAVTDSFGAGGSINAMMPGMGVAGRGVAASSMAMAGAGANASGGRVANYNVTVNESSDPLGSEGRIRKAFDMYGRM